MAGSNIFFAAILVSLMAIFSVVAVSAQDLSPSPAPAPAPDVGSGFSIGAPGAVICSSLLLSLVALLRH